MVPCVSHATVISKHSARARAIHWRYDSATPDYRRAHVQGGTYFFTVNTYRRQTFITEPDSRSALRAAIGTLRLTHPFVIEAWVLLPDHIHALRTLPPGDEDFSHPAGGPSSGWSRSAAKRDSIDLNG